MSAETLDTLPRARAEGTATTPSAQTRRVGRYRVVGMLGSGGMSVVYEGIDDVLGRRVAIKQLLRAGARVLREAQALARLAHPNVVAVYEIVEAEGEVFIVMERVEGWTLTTWIEERGPSRPERLDALVQAGRGVEAAHAVGIIHRDLKPQNIMVGDDGRVRVMDFGLARTTDDSTWDVELDAELPDAVGGLAAPLTGTGEQLGTRGYMAPEQYQGHPGDARSDVFGFSVVAYEVLHGRRLFQGSEAEVMQATLGGRFEPPPGSDVPAWLDAVIRRGLAVEPGARWPTMSALLEALARDPSARWRRAARIVVTLVLAIAIATAAVLGYLMFAEQWAHERAEQRASERLEAVEAAIARAETMGDRQAAEAAFRAFVLDPAHQGTRALSHAWLHRGARLHDDPVAAKVAYAEAYSLAHDPDDELAALRELAAVFYETWDGPALGQTIALLRARGIEDPELDELAFDAALWQRDLSGAIAALDTSDEPRAPWRPMLEQLGRVRSNETMIIGLSVLPPGLPARIAIRSTDPHEEVALLDEQLVEIERLRIEGSALHLISETTWALAQRDGELLLHDLLAGGEQIWRGASPGAASSVVAFDLRGDAVPELLLSRAWPALGLRAIDPRGGPEWIPHPGADALDSTIESFAVADLDGDGTDELVAAFGPWYAFDLRVFHRGEHGSLELQARHTLGRTAALAVVRRGDRRLLAAITDDSCPAPERFPEPPHTGAPAGVHLLSWAGGELREVDFVPLAPEHGLVPFEVGSLRAVGDFDGDDREDLAFNAGPRQSPGIGRRGPWLLLLRQTDDGFAPLYVADLYLWSAAQLDDDRALELLVSHPELGLLALGAGDRALPAARPPQSAARLPPPGIEDALLVARWQRAEDLAALGLPTIAAASLRDAEPLTSDHGVQLDLLDRAAELFFAGEAMEQVLAIDRRVREDPGLAAKALERSARALAHLGRHAEALTEAEVLLATPQRSRTQDELARTLTRDLAPLVSSDARVELRFDTPLDGAWVHHTPGALRRDPARSTLVLTIPARPESVAELPLDWDGGPLSLELDLEVERLEHGACLRVALMDEADETWLGGGLCTDGGGGGLRQVVALTVSGGPWGAAFPKVVHSGLHPRRMLIRMAYFPGRDLADFVIVEDERSSRVRLAVPPPRSGRQRLAIGAFFSGSQPALAVGELHRISIRGARLATPDPALVARDESVRLLAENEPLAALAALDRARVTHPRAEQIRLLAHAQLYDLEGLTRVAPTLLPHLNDPAWVDDLVLDLRAQPLAAAALRSAAGPAILPLLREAWKVMSTHRNDPDMHLCVLEQLAGIEALLPTTVEERGALRGLLYLRGRMWIHAASPSSGRRDLEAAVAMPASGELPDHERDTWSRAHLELARLLAPGDRAGSRRHLQQALRVAAWPEELCAISRSDPVLAPLLDATRCDVL